MGVRFLGAILVFLPLAISGTAQSSEPVAPHQKTQPPAKPASSSSDQPSEPIADIPKVTLEFKPQGPMPGIPGSNITSTTLCSSDGSLFMSIPQPPKYLPDNIYSFDSKGAHRFQASSAPGLYDVFSQGFFPGDDMLGILISATTDPQKSEYSFRTPDGKLGTGTAYRSPHHHYIVKFDRDGTYKSLIELPEGYDFLKFAELPDGTFVASAYDSVNRVPRLLLLDSSGAVLRPLEIPSDFQDIAELKKAESGDFLAAAHAHTNMSTWLFAPVRQHVVMYIAHRKPILLEIGVGGSVREVPIQSPPGYVIQDVLPSDDRWILAYRRKELPEIGFVDAHPETRNFVFYELDPNDGSLRREFQMTSYPGFGYGPACEHDGTFIGFSRTDGDGGFQKVTADAPR